MTIPAGNNWCPTCEAACHDHNRICTVCGAELQAPPPRRPRNSSSEPRLRAEDLLARAARIRQVMDRIQLQMQLTNADQQDLLRDLQNAHQEWQQVPAVLLDPQQQSSQSRPTSKQHLAQIPRITLTTNSSIFRQATLHFNASEMKAIPGEWAFQQNNFTLENARLVVAQPRTGKNGLSNETVQMISNSDSPVVVYMERGDGLTFCQKATMAQRAGAQAVVMGNNVPDPWPYVMKDSKGESQDLTIPVVMVKQSDGQSIVSTSRQDGSAVCTLQIKHQLHDCVICTETFAIGQKLLRLPACGHVFHESCALQWLRSHNTCPYCRRELPTDDADYEAERRRTQRTHAGSDGRANTSWHDLYG